MNIVQKEKFKVNYKLIFGQVLFYLAIAIVDVNHWTLFNS